LIFGFTVKKALDRHIASREKKTAAAASEEINKG
jgi:hypothetical protein